MPWTYMLRCADGSFYVGSARDLDARMTQHALGTDGSYTATRARKAGSGRASAQLADLDRMQAVAGDVVLGESGADRLPCEHFVVGHAYPTITWPASTLIDCPVIVETPGEAQDQAADIAWARKAATTQA